MEDANNMKNNYSVIITIIIIIIMITIISIIIISIIIIHSIIIIIHSITITIITHRQEVVVMCLEYVLTDSIDIDYGSVLSSQRKQDIIAGIYLCIHLCIHRSISSISIYLCILSMYPSIHLYLSNYHFIHPSINPSIDQASHHLKSPYLTPASSSYST